MYNRYVPQSDGSYQRCRMEEPTHHGEPHGKEPPAKPPETDVCPPLTQKPPQQRRNQRQPHHQPRQEKLPQPHSGNVLQFLKHLFPGDFDTGDLLVVLLLLLMSGDCQDEQNTAMLTLALYLLM